MSYRGEESIIVGVCGGDHVLQGRGINHCRCVWGDHVLQGKGHVLQGRGINHCGWVCMGGGDDHVLQERVTKLSMCVFGGGRVWSCPTRGDINQCGVGG